MHLNCLLIKGFYIIMKVIIRDAVTQFKKKKSKTSQLQVEQYILTHRLYNQCMPTQSIISQIFQKLKNHKQQPQQLQFYAKKKSNSQIFKIFQEIKQQGNGISYKQLSKKFKSDIISISHYCCKLDKLKLIQLKHEKDRIYAYPILQQSRLESIKTIKLIENIQNKFMFEQLSLLDNIWINISGVKCNVEGGFTNQEIRSKVGKDSENKMLRKIVQTLNYGSKIGCRKSKVFQYKFKNQTKAITKYLQTDRCHKSGLLELNPVVQQFLSTKFPDIEVTGSPILLKIINSHFKQYVSSIGIKESKRECTPLKFNRYVIILNEMHLKGPQSQGELQKTIIEKQKPIEGVGLMHKRSLLGIMNGLVQFEIIKQESGMYYPSWKNQEQMLNAIQNILAKRDRQKMLKNILEEQILKPTKKIKSDQYKTISRRQHNQKRKAQDIFNFLDKKIYNIYRKTFHNIKYVRRRKLQMFKPQCNLLHLIQEHPRSLALPQLEISSLQKMQEEVLPQLMHQYGHTMQQIEVDNEIVKCLRKNVTLTQDKLAIKYGHFWREKLKPLLESGHVEFNDNMVRLHFQPRGYLV